MADFTEGELFDIVSRRNLPERPSALFPMPSKQQQSRSQRQPLAPLSYPLIQQAAATPLSKLYVSINSSARQASSSAAGGAAVTIKNLQQLNLTLREVVKILRRQQLLGLTLQAATMSLLAPRVQLGSPQAEQLLQQLRSLGGEFATIELPKPGDYTLQRLHARKKGVRFSAGPGCFVDIPGADVSRSKTCSDPQSMPAGLRMGLVTVAFAVAAGEPIMLLGPTCFKTNLVEVWAELMGQGEDMVKVHMSPGGSF